MGGEEQNMRERERERERGLLNSDRMHTEINSGNTTVHAIKFTAYKN